MFFSQLYILWHLWEKVSNLMVHETKYHVHKFLSWQKVIGYSRKILNRYILEIPPEIYRLVSLSVKFQPWEFCKTVTCLQVRRAIFSITMGVLYCHPPSPPPCLDFFWNSPLGIITRTAHNFCCDLEWQKTN